MAERKAAKIEVRTANESSFASVAERWMELWQHGKSPRQVDSVQRRMAADVLPRLGVRPITQIEVPEVIAMAKLIEQCGRERDRSKGT